MTVTAFNSVGESDESDEIIVETLRATAPDAPSDVSASIDAAQIEISWSAPFNGGAALTSYTVGIQTADGTEYVESSNC